MHFGGDDWAVVDSCIDITSRRPVALDYLDILDVSPSAIRLIVATHWHDDHIRGLSEVLRVADKARFVISTAQTSRELTTLVQLVEPRMMLKSSGVAELAKVYEHLETTGSHATYAAADRRVWKPAGKTKRELWTLSPSDRAIETTLKGIAKLLDEDDLPNRRIPAFTPNDASVVLWAEAPGVVILLGADLEESADEEMGWRAIVASTARPPGKAAVFKVPHHGSVTGHNDDVWVRLLESDPLAILTPFSRGRTPLPTASDEARLNAHASAVYKTSHVSPVAAEWAPPVATTLAETTASIRDAEPSPGHLRLRKRADESSWRVELFGGATAV